MRFKTLIFILLMLFPWPAGAQEHDFPTLEALASLEIPPFDYVDLLRRLSRIRDYYEPPSEPPVYQVGDRESFTLPAGDNKGDESVPLELRGMTENLLLWVEASAAVSVWRAQALAERIDEEILLPLRQLFGFAEPPGVDGDPRLTIVIMRNADFSRSGFVPPNHMLPRTLYPDSNQREMLVVNIGNDDYDFTDDYIAEIIAHEYQHVLQLFRDNSEDEWLNEALAGFAEYFTSEPGAGLDAAQQLGAIFLQTPEIALTHLGMSDNQQAKYGAGALFIIYLAEQFGNEIVAQLQAETADGWRGVSKVLRETAGVSADDIFADWVLSNYVLDADRGFGYQHLQPLPNPPQPVATFSDFPALHSGSLPQYSSEYLAVNVRGADKLSLRLTQAPAAVLIETAPIEGEFFYFGVSTDTHSSRLTREIDLRTFSITELEFSIWYDLVENREFGYVQISTDRGKSWSILPGEHTFDRSEDGPFYNHGYTGSSGGWLQERIELNSYVGTDILLRFETLSDAFTTYNGMAIDDLRIESIDYHDGFESPDDAWREEGWIRTDNRLPQRTWLQVVQENAEGLHLSRHLMTSSGEVTIDVLPNVSQALIAISPVVPQTSMETQYSLEVNLLDAAGSPMTVARECTVTTTAALNFRAVPNGEKIGLLPQGTAVLALDQKEGWFKVEYDGKHGWIHADYIRTAGNCP